MSDSLRPHEQQPTWLLCPWNSLGKNTEVDCHFPAGQGRRHKRLRFNPWVWKIPWRRAWQPIPVFLSGKSHRLRNLAGYSPCGHKQSDTIDWAGMQASMTISGGLPLTHLESTSSQITKGISVLRLPRYNRRHVQDPEPRGLGQSRHESEQERETSIPGREETQLTFSVGWSRLKLLASWGGLLGSREKSKQERVRIWRQIRVLFLIAQGYHHMKDSSLTEA